MGKEETTKSKPSSGASKTSQASGKANSTPTGTAKSTATKKSNTTKPAPSSTAKKGVSKSDGGKQVTKSAKPSPVEKKAGTKAQARVVPPVKKGSSSASAKPKPSAKPTNTAKAKPGAKPTAKAGSKPGTSKPNANKSSASKAPATKAKSPSAKPSTKPATAKAANSEVKTTKAQVKVETKEVKPTKPETQPKANQQQTKVNENVAKTAPSTKATPAPAKKSADNVKPSEVVKEKKVEPVKPTAKVEEKVDKKPAKPTKEEKAAAKSKKAEEKAKKTGKRGIESWFKKDSKKNVDKDKKVIEKENKVLEDILDSEPVEPVEQVDEQQQEFSESVAEEVVDTPTPEMGDQVPPEEMAEEQAPVDQDILEEESALVKSLRAECDKMHDFALRTKADLDNIRKRNENLSVERYQDGKIETLSSLLPVLDSIDRALAIPMPDGVKDGVEKIKKQFEGIFEKMGVEEIPAEGEVFDPNLHNAMMQMENDDPEKSGKVVQVFEKGYIYKGKILRHASVVVAK